MPTPTFWKETDATEVVLEDAVHEGDGPIRIRRFFYGKSQLGVRFHVWELPPGASEGNHIHEGEDNLEEVYYFLRGQGLMWIEGQELPVAAGDAVLVPPGVDHGMRNTGAEPLRLVLLFGPPKG